MYFNSSRFVLLRSESSINCVYDDLGRRVKLEIANGIGSDRNDLIIFLIGRPTIRMWVKI